MHAADPLLAALALSTASCLPAPQRGSRRLLQARHRAQSDRGSREEPQLKLQKASREKILLVKTSLLIKQ